MSRNKREGRYVGYCCKHVRYRHTRNDGLGVFGVSSDTAHDVLDYKHDMAIDRAREAELNYPCDEHEFA